MFVTLPPEVDAATCAAALDRLRGLGLPAAAPGNPRTIGVGGAVDAELLRQALPAGSAWRPSPAPYTLVDRQLVGATLPVAVGGCQVGGPALTLMAGPCAVEDEAQIMACAASARAAGASFLRGGAYKPRTSPYAFQGLQHVGLALLRRAADRHGLQVVTEVLSTDSLPQVAAAADLLQVGARNMQNFALLQALGQVSRPVLLKRGMSATIEEWLLAAEYIVAAGNPRVILCERGIRTFETATRNTLDLSAVAVLAQLTHLPVVVDPSHATGRRDAVAPMAKAAVAAGADGLLIEMHPDPAHALSDGPQSLTLPAFTRLAAELDALAVACGRLAPGRQAQMSS